MSNNVFKPKRSNVPNSIPNVSNLADGELAVNSADKKIYIRDAANIIELSSVGSGGTGSSIQIQYNNINIGTGSTTLNFKGTGISSVFTQTGITTVVVDLQSNLDGGTPTSNYGGIESINGGGI